MTVDVREVFRAELVRQLQPTIDPDVIERVLAQVATVPVFGDIETYVAVAADVARGVLEAALQPTFDRLRREGATDRARIAELEALDAFHHMRTPRTIH